MGEIMDIRLGYAGNSKILKDSSVTKTVSVSVLSKEEDNNKKISKLKKVAKENILNTLKILENNKALGIKVYGLSPKLFPLANYPELEYFNYIDSLKAELIKVGDFIKENNFRVNIFLENTIILNSMSDKVLNDAIKDIKYQNVVLNTMGLDEKCKIVVNVGGAYRNKNDLVERFRETLKNLDEAVKKRLVLKNDDNSINQDIMMGICDEFSIPFFLNVDDKNIESEFIKKSILSWKEHDLPALFGLSSNSGIMSLSKYNKDIDVILQNSEKDKNILMLNIDKY